MANEREAARLEEQLGVQAATGVDTSNQEKYKKILEDAKEKRKKIQQEFSGVDAYQGFRTALWGATREEVALLHEDYRILNGYVVKKYGLRNCLNGDISLDNEPLCKIAAFRLREFADDMACDFSEHCNGKTHFLTENMLDEFVETYVPLAVEEIVHLKKGKSLLRAADYAWPRKI